VRRALGRFASAHRAVWQATVTRHGECTVWRRRVVEKAVCAQPAHAPDPRLRRSKAAARLHGQIASQRKLCCMGRRGRVMRHRWAGALMSN